MFWILRGRHRNYGNNEAHGSEPWGQISAQLVSVLRDFTLMWVFFEKNRVDYGRVLCATMVLLFNQNLSPISRLIGGKSKLGSD